ncbi:hypothetical protein [Embleya sp. NPDC005971]|uniref:zinc finger domain-containing protein n=1 Tax=Embleya sp. NPDC005971 TaxID=3156724 RepID=UPI0033C899F8
MDEVEAAHLTRYVRAICPQQKFDEFTADAWYDVLFPYSFEDCKAAAAACARESPFVAPAEIVAEVRRVRKERLKNYVYEPEQNEDWGLDRLREQLAAVADGLAPPEIENRRDRPLLQLVAKNALATNLPPDVEAVIKPLRHPAREVRCPKESCRALEGQSCETADRRIMPGGVHPQRIVRWAVERVTCPECAAGPSASCREADGVVPRQGAHSARVQAAEREAA